MELGAFQIIPSVFEIHQGQSIPIFVQFKPTSPSFYVRLVFLIFFIWTILDKNEYAKLNILYKNKK